MLLRSSCGAAALCVVAGGLQAAVVLVGQSRTVTALATFDGTGQTASATAFEPLVATVTAATEFPTAGGGTGNNTAVASINCLVDPNAITASGNLTADGGFAVTGGPPSEVFGEAAATIFVTFQVETPTAFQLTALPRPTTGEEEDEFELELEPMHGGNEVFRLGRHDAPRSVDESGVLPPGEYQLHYEVELRGGASTADAQFGMNFLLSSPCGGADIGSAGGADGWDGRLDNNDFIAFINRFFAQDNRADVGEAGGVGGSDGLLDNNDFIAFIGLFFAGGPSCR